MRVEACLHCGGPLDPVVGRPHWRRCARACPGSDRWEFVPRQTMTVAQLRRWEELARNSGQSHGVEVVRP